MAAAPQNNTMSSSFDFQERGITYCDVPMSTGEVFFSNSQPSIAIVEDSVAATESVPYSLMLPLPLLASSSFQDDDKNNRMAGVTTARVASVVEQLEPSSNSSSYYSSSTTSSYIDHSLLPPNMMMRDSKKRPYEQIASGNNLTGICTGLGGERSVSSSSSSSSSSLGSRMNTMNSGDEHFNLKCNALAEYCEKNNALPPR